MPSTNSSSSPMSVMSGAPANMIGRAPATSATARRLRSPTRCAVNRFSTRCVVAITPTTGRFMSALSRSLPANRQMRRRAASSASSRIGRGVAKLKRSQRLAARPELLAGAGKDPRALRHPRGDVLGRAAPFRKNRPTPDTCRRAASSARRAPPPRCARRTGRGFRRDKAAARRATPRRCATPLRSRSCRSRCRSRARSPRSARRAASSAPGWTMTQAPTWAPARLKVLVAATQVIRRSAISGAAVMVGVCLAPANTRSQWISSETRIRSCSAQKRRQRAELVRRPGGAAGIVRAAQEHDLGPRRQLAAQRVEVHRVAALRARPAARRECAARWRR